MWAFLCGKGDYGQIGGVISLCYYYYNNERSTVLKSAQV